MEKSVIRKELFTSKSAVAKTTPAAAAAITLSDEEKNYIHLIEQIKSCSFLVRSKAPEGHRSFELENIL